MTGNTTQATIDVVDLLVGSESAQSAAIRTRFGRMSLSILYFACGCAVSATLYWLAGFWCLAVPVVVAAIAATMRTDAPP